MQVVIYTFMTNLRKNQKNDDSLRIPVTLELAKRVQWFRRKHDTSKPLLTVLSVEWEGICLKTELMDLTLSLEKGIRTLCTSQSSHVVWLRVPTFGCLL